MFSLKKAGKMFVQMFVPGIGMTEVPYEDVPDLNSPANYHGVVGYRSIKEIKAMARANGVIAESRKKPTFVLSKSRTFRRRVGRIIYGKEGENMFL
jgi:hypothetical protein